LLILEMVYYVGQINFMLIMDNFCVVWMCIDNICELLKIRIYGRQYESNFHLELTAS
jgi:hypothetical protein